MRAIRPRDSACAAPRRCGARRGFTLAEALVALALVGLTLLPATIVLHRLLRADARLRATLLAEAASREMLEAAALDARRGLPLEATRVRYGAEGAVRLVRRWQAATVGAPARLSVAARGPEGVARACTVSLPPVWEERDGAVADP